MKLHHGIIAVVAAVVIVLGGVLAVAQARGSSPEPGDRPAGGDTVSDRTSPVAQPTPTPTPTPTPAATTTSAPPPAPAPVDRLSEENLIRERLYHDVTGHDLSLVDEVQDSHERLGPCTGETTFADVLPARGLSQLEAILAGSDVTRVTEIVAQTSSSAAARRAADRIVAMVQDCPAITGGDFGYGDPVAVPSDDAESLVYFPGYDSDRRYGGYIVFSVGNRVGVVSVADAVGPGKVRHLATEVAGIAGV